MRDPKRTRMLAVLTACTVLSPAHAQDHDESWVAAQVEAIRQSDTPGWDRIPWVASLLEARRISGRERQPVFLFTLDGNLETGRC
jgi:hypothetical protein